MDKNELQLISAYTRIRTMHNEAGSIMCDLSYIKKALEKQNKKEQALDIEVINEDVRKAYFALDDAINDIEDLMTES